MARVVRGRGTAEDEVVSFIGCFIEDLLGAFDGDDGGQGNENGTDGALGDPDTRVRVRDDILIPVGKDGSIARGISGILLSPL